MKTCPICMNAMPYEWVVCSCDSRIQGLVRVNLPKIDETLVVQHMALTPVVEKELKADGWRRCAEGQGETQHCALLEAAVLAEREACAEICAKFYWDAHVEGAQNCESAIRKRGNT